MSQLRFFHAYGRPNIVYIWDGAKRVSWTRPHGNKGYTDGYDLDRVTSLVTDSRWVEISRTDEKKAFDEWRYSQATMA